MALNQYVYFVLSSECTAADEITALLGIEPDETAVRGSRSTSPVVLPRCHRWKIVCNERGLRVDDQIACVIERLRPHTAAIARLTGRPDSDESPWTPVLQVVRYFNDDFEEEPAPASDEINLFGWHLDRDVLDFLLATGAEVDIDEYDMARGGED
ncbi:DUF4279 domain-containing protein [Kitasatospora sp. NPDC089509]|uniref:DUF4279 domain-containing protein n=1 Tax=Kitasatospora sp. NPDC089509 TaxID=3364079 RepID=UPI00381F8E10